MSDRSRSKTWLFSFVDLSFLLLIAVTQLAGSGTSAVTDFGEILLPQVRAEGATTSADSATRWQVRVHPPHAAGSDAFELAEGPGDGSDTPRISLEQLGERLTSLRESATPKPLLAPHEDARAGDLLAAAALIEDAWPSEARAAVAPIGPVAAGPPPE